MIVLPSSTTCDACGGTVTMQFDRLVCTSRLDERTKIDAIISVRFMSGGHLEGAQMNTTDTGEVLDAFKAHCIKSMESGKVCDVCGWPHFANLLEEKNE